MIAHVAGVPLEESAPPVTGAGTCLLLARAWQMVHLRRRHGRSSRAERRLTGQASATAVAGGRGTAPGAAGAKRVTARPIA